ncbi:hypothetical protein [Cellulomonas sp. P5_C5]
MRLRRKLAVAATSVVLAGSGSIASAGPAAAVSSYAELFISPSWDHPGYYVVVVSGHVHNAPGITVGMRLIGDDPVFNDDLGVSRSTNTPTGDFSIEVLVWHGTLNEDPEGRDEIFAKVSASNGWTRSTANVNGYY